MVSRTPEDQAAKDALSSPPRTSDHARLYRLESLERALSEFWGGVPIRDLSTEAIIVGIGEMRLESTRAALKEVLDAQRDLLEQATELARVKVEQIRRGGQPE